jgi:hypothetical protein
MKISNRNIKLRLPFKILWIFCGLFMLTSILVKGSNSNPEKQEKTSATFKVNQHHNNNSFFQDWRSTLPYNFLSIFSSAEESEPTDENTGEETDETDFPLHLPAFNHNFLKSSFANFNLSFQKRINIPFFLLHHSWKIPFI